MEKTLVALKDNLVFALEFVGIAVAIFAVAGVAQTLIRKKRGDSGKYFNTRVLVTCALLSALSTILMILELPFPIAPGFYKFDLSELPGLIGGFVFGPLAGIVIEFVKIVLKVLVKGTSTAFVGELANFLVGSVLIFTASLIYELKKTKMSAIIGCTVGTLLMTTFGVVFNALYLIPVFARMFNMDLDAIIGMGSKVNFLVKDLVTLVLFAVAPLNIVKGGVVSLIAVLVYKKIRKIVKY